MTPVVPILMIGKENVKLANTGFTGVGNREAILALYFSTFTLMVSIKFTKIVSFLQLFADNT